MRRAVVAALLPACLVVLVAGCATGDRAPAAATGEDATTAPEPGGSANGRLTAHLVDPAGKEVGTATFSDAEGGLEVSVEVHGLPPGFHGLHLHAIGLCEPGSVNPADPSMRGDFLSAGGHIGAGETDHGAHAGDLPTLYVTRSGTGSLTTVTDAVTRTDLIGGDGSALLIHAGRDDYANIPERYAPGGPDATTRNTGDAGGRIACGTVKG
jgi:superoxide dismutase, Cu-Zn family